MATIQRASASFGMYDFQKLRVWHDAKAFCVGVYQATDDFPRREMFGLTAQLRSSARSIAANIAEGSGYTGKRDSARFYEISVGSGCECLSDLIISTELGYLSADAFRKLDSLLVPTRKQLIRLVEASRSRR